MLLATVTRSPSSLKQYGPNVAVLLRPDSSIAAVQTLNGFLVTYNVSLDREARIYQQVYESGQTRRQSSAEQIVIEQEQKGVREVNVSFRMVIKIDAGIGKALALDDELIVATQKPAAVQCIRWAPVGTGSQTSTELVSRMPWIHKKSAIKDIIYDRPMSLAVWISGDGAAYAVQRVSGPPKEPDPPRKLFKGYEFHRSDSEACLATKAAINARFSLLAVGCANAEIRVYCVRDYAGSIPLSHLLQPPASLSTTGKITSLSYSPDGHCLFVGYEKGWAFWSVYGKPGASSFAADRGLSRSNAEGWLNGVCESAWFNGGLNLLLSSSNDGRLWALGMAKSAVTGCFSAANIARLVLLTDSSLMIYRGYDLPILTTLSGDTSLWHHIQMPSAYLTLQRPIRSVVTSLDGRYVAVAGRRGLAHYSVGSGRWKTFEDAVEENAFVVRGGMCWYQHILIAAIDTEEHQELRLYSRERSLGASSLIYTERLPSSAVVIALVGQDSLLVYTYENVLYHYVINASGANVTLVQVGQIALHGIVRAPARVRAVSWILPDHQLRDGDPSQDVATASVLFLVDAKLVLLQPSTHDESQLKYDMRVMARNVEYFDLMRDQLPLTSSPEQSPLSTPLEGQPEGFESDRGLRDSLWYFDGKQLHCWSDVESLLQCLSIESESELPEPISVSTDFYPSSIVLDRGVVLGLDADLIQRRDVQFAFFRYSVRTQLFLPQVLQRFLASFDSAAASSLSRRYSRLPYFSHALEILLHMVLDEEVDTSPNPEDAMLPSVISFLSSFPDYLDIIVQCTRKTEVRSWRTLFAHLPPPLELFEASLAKDLLKTAGGYLLVLHNFNDLESSSQQCVRLLQRAKDEGEWELCKELARFLLALDASGDTLREALAKIELAAPSSNADNTQNIKLKTPRPDDSKEWKVYNTKGAINGGLTRHRSLQGGAGSRSPRSRSATSEEGSAAAEDDYFSPRSSMAD